MVTVDDLYKHYELLSDAKGNAGKHEKEFLVIIEAVHGGSAEKRLASQLISKFFKYFPQHTDSAMNAQLDLCEDEDVNIRKQAIRDLPSICKESPENLPRIADVLTQLLQTEDLSEQNLVQNALVTLMKNDTKGTLQGIFTQIVNGDDTIREKALKFLSLKLKALGSEHVSPKIEEFIVEESKKVLADVTGDEFLLFMTILSALKCMQTLQGRQHLVDIIGEQAGFDSEFDATDADCVERLIQCTQQALPMFSKNAHSTKYVAYYLDQVIGKLADIPTSDGENQSLELCKQLADMSQWSPQIDKLVTRLPKLYVAIQAYMPLPVAEVLDLEGSGDNENTNPQPKLEFSHVECLLYSLHALGRNCPEFLSKSDDESVTERMKDFKIRLQYMFRGVQSTIKQLKSDLQGKRADALKTDENRVKVAALKCTTNIQTIIRDLMHQPPSYKAVLKLSWKPATGPSGDSASVAAKRRSTENNSAVPGKTKTSVPHMDRAVYQPPTGKYSDKAGSAPAERGGRGGQTGSNRGSRGGMRSGQRGGQQGGPRGRGAWRGRRW